MKFNLGRILDLGALGRPMDPSQHAAMVAVQEQVRSAFGWSADDDINSSERMRAYVNNLPEATQLGWDASGRRNTLEGLRDRLLEATQVIMIGAAIERDDLRRSWPKGTEFVAADGAVGACLGLVEPLCVVTDLDGGVHLEQAVTQRIPMVVHGHGDNEFRWRHYLKVWSQDEGFPLVLTHQTERTYDDMHNPGGFTDGDRGVCFVAWLGIPIENIRLLGYAEDRVGTWSGVTNPERKLAKLAWMAKVLDAVLPNWKNQEFPPSNG